MPPTPPWETTHAIWRPLVYGHLSDAAHTCKSFPLQLTPHLLYGHFSSNKMMALSEGDHWTLITLLISLSTLTFWNIMIGTYVPMPRDKVLSICQWWICTCYTVSCLKQFEWKTHFNGLIIMTVPLPYTTNPYIVAIVTECNITLTWLKTFFKMTLPVRMLCR